RNDLIKRRHVLIYLKHPEFHCIQMVCHQSLYLQSLRIPDSTPYEYSKKSVMQTLLAVTYNRMS
ncbi:TPA: hypothetical protein ACPFHY_004825, partial [Escherichia coli]